MAPIFSFADSIIDRNITILRESLLLYPQYFSEHTTCVYNLVVTQWARHQLSRENETMDKFIVHCTEAIKFIQAENSVNIVRLLFIIACALLERFRVLKQSHDIKYAIKYLRYLRELPLDSIDIPRDDVTTSLMHALNTQGDSEAGNGTRDIKEMVVLCRDLLTSNLSPAGFPNDAFTILREAVDKEFLRGRVKLLDHVIEFLRHAAKACPPDSHQVILALASTLRTRFVVNYSNDDYEEATALLERILDPDRPGECPDLVRDSASSVATQLALARSIFFQNPQYSAVTISHLRTTLSSSSVNERTRLHLTKTLEDNVRERSEHYSLAESLQEANSYTAQLADLSSSERLVDELTCVPDGLKSYSMTRIAEKIRRLLELLSITPPETNRHRYLCLSHLAAWYKSKFDRTNDISDIEESIKYRRLELEASHISDTLRIISLRQLSFILFHAFMKTSKIGYLDESITISYDVLKLESARFSHFYVVGSLVTFLLIREELLGRREDLHEAIRLFPMAVDNQHAPEPARFQLACRWAILARIISHPTTLTAYKSAMTLMKKSLSFAPTVSIQHTRLVAMSEYCQTMPLDYASFQIHLGRFEEAFETLEQGRALLWSEMRGLRAPVAQHIDDSPLAKRFADINQELEVLTISITPSARPDMEDGVAKDRDGMDPFGRLVVKRKKLEAEREALIPQIQGRPGLEGFSAMPSFATLRSAASRGPVILINHCKWRSDILILLHSSLPRSIPTPDGFYDRANKLRDKLVEARKHGLDSRKYQDALCSVLKGLYELVGEPVIKKLRVLGVREQSRIWLCPTSVFCSLPLHAMGPIPSSDAHERYFSDLYIPSYTPSLSALIESREASPQTLGKPSLLLVAQPDDDLPGVKGEIKVVRRALEGQATVTGLVSSEATPSSVVEGLRGSRFAHFACHGVLETGKPFDASFKLHGGSRLTLLDMVQSRLPDAEFAFLSCCHTAENTEKSIADEALHLTAAMQYCGFRSVVGTMWEMADTDGRDLAKSFYKSLFSGREIGVPYYERSAGALRDATQKLRGKRGITLERWVNFVHYGA